PTLCRARARARKGSVNRVPCAPGLCQPRALARQPCAERGPARAYVVSTACLVRQCCANGAVYDADGTTLSRQARGWHNVGAAKRAEWHNGSSSTDVLHFCVHEGNIFIMAQEKPTPHEPSAVLVADL